jgi:hypothetical protein
VTLQSAPNLQPNAPDSRRRWLHHPVCKFDLRPGGGSILGFAVENKRRKRDGDAIPKCGVEARDREQPRVADSRRLITPAVQAPRLLPIGNDAVNTLLGGGLPIGGICEFTGPAIDVSDSLDARSVAAAGVRLQNPEFHIRPRIPSINTSSFTGERLGGPFRWVLLLLIFTRLRRCAPSQGTLEPRACIGAFPSPLYRPFGARRGGDRLGSWTATALRVLVSAGRTKALA